MIDLKIGYIREKEVTCDIVKQIIVRIERFFSIVKFEKINDKIFITLPITSRTKLNKYTTKRLAKAVLKKLYDNCIENVVLSKHLEDLSLFKNILYSENMNILDGKYLFKVISYNILQYIYEYKKEATDMFGEVSILANDLTEEVRQSIILISKNTKRLNVITNNIERFKKIDDYLYNELGILINVSNNKNKSLKSTEIIINYDFPSELINKYNINPSAIIINIPENAKIDSKRFNGVYINNFRINIPSEYKIKGFSDEIVYESIIYRKNDKQIRKMLFNDNVKIKKLIGIKGIINNKEFAKMA